MVSVPAAADSLCTGSWCLRSSLLLTELIDLAMLTETSRVTVIVDCLQHTGEGAEKLGQEAWSRADGALQLLQAEPRALTTRPSA